eukprot:TRINITY_DN5690_c0_g1_i1.p1 TRINITY_DN5690_c0_g1~~TRINITY_DN5690_c0_g1_i1.p1  ORF type:complete len:124 (+),score=14.23 TRINITY_DN5690_c0_g1_i1:187-558(+)
MRSYHGSLPSSDATCDITVKDGSFVMDDALLSRHVVAQKGEQAEDSEYCIFGNGEFKAVRSKGWSHDRVGWVHTSVIGEPGDWEYTTTWQSYQWTRRCEVPAGGGEVASCEPLSPKDSPRALA